MDHPATGSSDTIRAISGELIGDPNARSRPFLELSITADQCVRRAVVLERRFGRALELRDDALRQHLSQFHAPLIERVDLPDDALSEHQMLVKSD